MKVYFISGLAADRRVFRNIQLPEGYEAHYLDWIPVRRNETLPQYAMRLAESMDASEPFALIGLSFGGMLAIEIAKRYKPVATVLIASIPLSNHLPGYYRVAVRLGLHRIISPSLMRSSVIAKRFFTSESKEDKLMIKQVAEECDLQFVRWGIDAIINWENVELPTPLWHIHGAKDGILPVKYTTPTHKIPGAGHLLVTTKATEINTILEGLF
jgi:pimeloyl-ACP methyl ester carboxylesterase